MHLHLNFSDRTGQQYKDMNQMSHDRYKIRPGKSSLKKSLFIVSPSPLLVNVIYERPFAYG